MIDRRNLLFGAAAAGLAMPAAARARALIQGRPARVFYLSESRGWRHAPVIRPEGGGPAPSEAAMTAIAERTGAFTVELSQDATEITPELLRRIDVLAFYTTGPLPVSAQNWQAVQAWVASGRGGVVGLHSAADTGLDFEGGDEAWTRFINGRFAGHPWNQGDDLRVRTYHTDHPTTAMWPAAFDYREEIYQYQGFDPARVRVLQGLDFPGTPIRRPWAVPVTWVRQVGQGRLFFTNLGHTPETWEDPRFQSQIVEAVAWARGLGRAEADPNPSEQAVHAIEALLAYAGDDPALAQNLARRDDRWLRTVHDRISGLKPIYPADEDADHAPFDAALQAVRDQVLAEAR